MFDTPREAVYERVSEGLSVIEKHGKIISYLLAFDAIAAMFIIIRALTNPE